MGNNQAQAKKFLVPLIHGAQINLGPKEQGDIALWSVRSAMAAEFLDAGIPRVPQQHRAWLMDKLEPPPNWFVWIGGYGGNWPFAHTEVISAAGGTLVPTPFAAAVSPRHAYSLTIVLGRLIIYVASIDLPDQHLELSEGVMWPIWPRKLEQISWPPPRLASDEEVVYLATDQIGHFPLRLKSTWKRTL
jgi:hypothetical protein